MSGYRLSWLRGALVVAQVALSLALMIAAGLALRGLERMRSINLGFNPQNAVKLSFDLDLQGYDRFTEQDDEKSLRVAVINETFARRFWPNEDAIGKRFSLSSGDNLSLQALQAPLQVVGIVEDGKYRSLSEAPLPFAFLPLKQSYNGLTTLVARTAGERMSAIAAIRRELQQFDPRLPIFDEETLTDNLRLSLLPARIVASLLGGFGALSLTLAAIGIFGVMSYTVSRRTHEIGVRIALGAKTSDVLSLLLRQGMTPVALGIGLGLAGALALTRLMAPLLFGINPADLLTFAGVALLLTVIAFVACYVPARRAAKVDPMVALRSE